ncbi:MAG: flippase-like domain-containing protein [Bacilli bacterium]|jgi:uncharacterized protein (TIRG00374 family)|nr:flippase-like domain-containing protein [Bacilli bacterium]MCI2054796.1 flippase-like domain-containing protein [Bacilli bacterium]
MDKEENKKIEDSKEQSEDEKLEKNPAEAETPAEVAEDKEKKQDETNQKQFSKKSVAYKVALFLLITVIAFSIIFSFTDLNEVWDAITKVQGTNMWIAAGCIIVYMLIWPLSLVLIARVKKIKATPFDTYLIGGTEHFFNGVTPFSTGGQPFQVYAYTKVGVKAADSTGMILMNFIAYMIATNAFAIASLFFYGDFSVNFNSSTKWIIILGFVMNFLTLAFMICMATCKWVRDVFTAALKGLCKVKWIGKHLTKAIPMFEQYCDNAQLAAKEVFSHKWLFMSAVLIKLVDLVFYYAIPFFILRALGVHVEWSQIYLFILASSFAITTMVWVPTPGGTGGIEMAFTMIFSALAVGVNASVVSGAMLLWRALTYYFLMLLSFLEYLWYKARVRRRNSKEKKEASEAK